MVSHPPAGRLDATRITCRGGRVGLRARARTMRRMGAALGCASLFLLGVFLGGSVLPRGDTSPVVGATTGAVASPASGRLAPRTLVTESLPVGDRVALLAEVEVEDAGAYVDGLASVKVGGRWGYMDRMGQLIIPPQFEEAGWFSGGAAAVKRDGRWGYIDRTGRLFVEPQFDQASSFSRGLAPVKVGDLWGYVDRTGRMVIAPQFEIAYPFWDTITAARLGGRWVVIDVTGRVVFDPATSGRLGA